MRRTFLILASLFLFLSPLAHAHLVSARFGEFYAGLLHPLTSLVHLIPWVALALFASMQDKRTSRWSVLVFPLLVILGACFGWASYKAGEEVPQLIAIANMLSFVVLGACIVSALHVAKLFFSLAVFFGFTHGFSNGLVALEFYPFLLYLAGVFTAAYLSILLVSSLGFFIAQRFAWSSIAIRVLGSWVFAAGAIYTGFSFVGGQ